MNDNLGRNGQALDDFSYSIFGYYPSWRANLEKDKYAFEYATHITLHNGRLTSEGVVGIPNNFNKKKTEDFISKVHRKQNNKAYITFLEHESILAKIADSGAACQKLADSINKLCTVDYKFDGVDIDWETNNKDDGEKCVKLCQNLYRRLKVRLNLTIPWRLKINHGNLSGCVDSVNVMFYNYADNLLEKSEHNAPLFRIREYVRALPKSFPRRKLRLGIPFLGYRYDFEYGVSPKLDNKATTYSYPHFLYTQIHDAVTSGEWLCSSNESNGDMAPTLTSYKTNQLISFDDAESVVRKCRYVKAEGLGGAMVYALGFDRIQGDDTQQPLLQAVHEELRGTCDGL